MEVIGDEIGDDHVFNFLYDWRLSHADVAAQLHDYLAEVCALTGHDKVSVYSISQGSLLLGTYMYEYPNDNYIDARCSTLRFSRAATSSPISTLTSPLH